MNRHHDLEKSPMMAGVADWRMQTVGFFEALSNIDGTSEAEDRAHAAMESFLNSVASVERIISSREISSMTRVESEELIKVRAQRAEVVAFLAEMDADVVRMLCDPRTAGRTAGVVLDSPMAYNVL
jgi:hypothetical protein